MQRVSGLRLQTRPRRRTAALSVVPSHSSLVSGAPVVRRREPGPFRGKGAGRVPDFYGSVKFSSENLLSVGAVCQQQTRARGRWSTGSCPRPRLGLSAPRPPSNSLLLVV